MSHRPAVARVRRRAAGRLLVALATVVLVGAGCANDNSARGPAPIGDLTLIEKDYAFQPETLQAPVGRELTVVIDNRDSRVGHNVRFPTVPDSPRTKVEPGPGYQTLKVRFDQPGRYPFVCDLHPTMKGTVVAS